MSLLGYDKALQKVLSYVEPMCEDEALPIGDCLGKVLAASVFASDDHPRFDNSAVDGYAVGSRSDSRKGLKLPCVGVSAPGGPRTESIPEGKCIRVLTGALLPPSTYGVAMQEDVERADEEVVFTEGIAEGGFVRRRGGDFRAGQELLRQGMRVGPGAIALAASQGISAFVVRRRVRVALFTSGDELHERPGIGEIRDSNRPMLAAQVRLSDAEIVSEARLPDDPARLERALTQADRESDLIVVSGGVSVGDRDFLPQVVPKLGTSIFHGLNARPGKPTLAAKLPGSLLLGLPGNPASSFVMYALFAEPVIRCLMGYTEGLRWVPLRYGARHEPAGREDFIRCVVQEDAAIPFHQQDSSGLLSLASAQALARLDARRTVLPGEQVPVLLL